MKPIINKADIHLSIISHGQWSMITDLLADLSQLNSATRLQITLTFNIKESFCLEPSAFPFPIHIIKNNHAKGFGENHNIAFQHPPDSQQRQYFAVINPDIRMTEDVFSILSELMTQDNTLNKPQKPIGVITSAIKNSQGLLEDGARELPTPWRIVKKLVGQKKHWHHKEYEIYQPDWIAGMFMLFRANDFATMQGFKTTYFLYYEDVELCSRLWLSGFCIVVKPDIAVVHNAQRSSHRKLNYLRWHLTSMAQFFLSSTYRKVKKFHQHRILQK